ncbi:hypothetical protein B0H13DRAFT_2532417 [Mycena leptocephala]|nr:hypothetical protein B0H13DRAFT_2532417 [Mycena leptocephala]
MENSPSSIPAPAPLPPQTSCPTPRDAFVCARVVAPSRLPTPRHTTTTPFLPTHHDLHAVARPPLRSPCTPAAAPPTLLRRRRTQGHHRRSRPYPPRHATLSDPHNRMGHQPTPPSCSAPPLALFLRSTQYPPAKRLKEEKSSRAANRPSPTASLQHPHL